MERPLKCTARSRACPATAPATGCVTGCWAPGNAPWATTRDFVCAQPSCGRCSQGSCWRGVNQIQLVSPFGWQTNSSLMKKIWLRYVADA